MKALHIALKDMLRAFRSAFALVFMFVLPMLTTGIIAFAFSGLGSGDGGFDLPTTRVVVANLDRPPGGPGVVSAGQALVATLQDEGLADLLEVSTAAGEADARAAVDDRRADLAVIVPPDFTAAAFGGWGGEAVVLYQDPTLTLGPAIVRDLVGRFVDGFAGAIIAAEVTSGQLAAAGVALEPSEVEGVARAYASWLEPSAARHGAGPASDLDVRAPQGERAPANPLVEMIAGIMTGMLVFYAFFTGASTAQSIVREDEEGTLARLFTTPTPITTILGGKFLAVFATVIVQAIVTMIAARLIFGVRWGAPAPMGLALVALVVVAAGFGVFLMSFVKNNRQAGPVMGGVLTVTGMAGGLMTSGLPPTPTFETITLFTPQGWVLRLWKQAVGGAAVGELLLPFAVSLAIGVVLFAVGARVFRRRFV